MLYSILNVNERCLWRRDQMQRMRIVIDEGIFLVYSVLQVPANECMPLLSSLRFDAMDLTHFGCSGTRHLPPMSRQFGYLWQILQDRVSESFAR
jgi:hypothetical protein